VPTSANDPIELPAQAVDNPKIDPDTNQPPAHLPGSAPAAQSPVEEPARPNHPINEPDTSLGRNFVFAPKVTYGGAKGRVTSRHGRETVELEAIHHVKEGKGFPDPEEFAAELGRHRDAIQELIDREGLQGLQSRIREYQSAKSELQRLRSEINPSLGSAGEGRAWSHYPDMVIGADPFAIGGAVDARINSIIGASSKQWAEQILRMDSTSAASYRVNLRVVVTY
jgi:hypothetical protein